MRHLLKRGDVYWYDCLKGGVRQRFSLGTRDPRVAKKLVQRIEFSIADGPRSEHWQELRPDLPEASFKQLTADRNVPIVPALNEFQKRFEDRLDRRVKLGELAERSAELYTKTASAFFTWLAENGVRIMDEILPETVEKYLVERRTSILKRGGNGNGLVTDFTSLSSLFNFAIEEGVLQVSPLKGKYQPDSDPEGAEPFTKEELDRLDAAAKGETRTAFLILKNTGLRGGDVADLTWRSYEPYNKCLTVLTRKRKKWTTIPLTQQFMQYLSEIPRDAFDLDSQILPGMNRGKLYRLMTKLGGEAGVPNAHPHRYRHTLAVTILERGGSIFDVARILGDEVATVDKSYGKYTDGLQDRVRGILEGK